MNPSAILISLIYSNGNRKMAAFISFYIHFSPSVVCTSYLCSFLSNFYLFVYIFCLLIYYYYFVINLLNLKRMSSIYLSQYVNVLLYIYGIL